MATLDEILGSGTATGGGTNGTLSTQGLYTRPKASNQGLAGTGVASAGDGLGYVRRVGSDGLVEDRLNNLTSANSAYINQARTSAQRYAAGRGLGNSAVAGAYGIEAAIRNALPIASQDASAINQASSESLGAMNAGLQQERALMNEATLAGAELNMQERLRRSQLNIAAAARANDLRMQRERLGFEGEQAGLNRNHEYNMIGYEAQIRGQLEDNAAFRQDWLSNQDFGRQSYADMLAFQRNLVMMGYGAEIDSTASFNAMLAAYALENPDVFNAQNYTQVGTFMSNFNRDRFAQLFADWGIGG